MPIASIGPVPESASAPSDPTRYDGGSLAMPAPSLTRNFLVPVSLVCAFSLYYWARVPLWAVALAVLPMVVLYALAPVWAARSMADFDRRALALRVRGEERGLRALFRAAASMRLFAPPALVAEREGMTLTAERDFEGAVHAYERALEGWSGTAPISLIVAYAHAAYDAGAHAAAIGAFRKAHTDSPELPRVSLRLIHSLIRRSKSGDADDAAELLAQLPRSAQGDFADALRALLDATRGNAKQARAARDTIRARDPDADVAELIEEIDVVLRKTPTSARKRPPSGGKRKKPSRSRD